MTEWVYDVLIPALNRGRGWLETHLWALSMVTAATSLILSREYRALRLVCLGLYLVLQRRILKKCRRRDGGFPWIVYVSALFPPVMLWESFLTIPLVWQVCILIWAKYQR